MKEKRILIIIEELGEITTSAAIVNWNLSVILNEEYTNVDILTLDNISDSLKNSWLDGNIYTHPKENHSKIQKILLRIPKIRGLIQILLGNDFEHYNRVKHIRKFLKKNKENYKTYIALSGGSGFSPHFALSNVGLNGNKIGIMHDPYPKSLYPEEFKGSSKLKDYFKIKSFQRVLTNFNQIVFPSQKLFEWFSKDYSIDTSKVKIIPHAIEFNSETEKELKTQRKIKITHTGTLLKPRDPSVFITSFLEASNTNNLLLEFYGSIENKLKEKIIIYNSNKNVLIHPNRVKYNVALNKLYNSDFLLLIESNSKENPFLPTKFVDYVNIGKPIIALTTKGSEVYRLLGDEYPFICNLYDSNQIKDIIQSKIIDKKFINLSLEKINELKKYFSKENILLEYKKIISD